MVIWSVISWTIGAGFVTILPMILRQMIYWRLKGIPHVRVPLIFGFLSPIFFRKKSFPQWARDCYNACPGAKYYGSMDFNTLVLIIKDPDLVKEISVKGFDHFPNHRSFVGDEFDPLLARNIFSLKDNRWREVRSSLSPTFTVSKMKYMFELVMKCAMDFVQYIKLHPELANEINLKDAYTRYTNDVIATVVFGISINSMIHRDNDFYINGKDATSFDGWLKGLKFLGARICPKLMRFMGQHFLSPKADKFFKTIVNDTIEMRDSKGIVRPDMINLLMQARNNGNGIKITNDDIIGQAFIFFLAGFDTSSRLMCFLSHVLSHHSEIQERLRDEIDAIFDEEQQHISYEGLLRMKYMDMVVSETLRLYPPTAFTDRVCGKSYNLPPPTDDTNVPFTVNPNTTMCIPIYGFHHDPNFFPDPEKFDPERFNDENKNRIKPCTYIPFGIGPRKCIGERFALMETKILIAQLLHNFVLIPSKKTTKEINFVKKSFSIEPENGFWVTFEKRKLR